MYMEICDIILRKRNIKKNFFENQNIENLFKKLSLLNDKKGSAFIKQKMKTKY